jgi:hypothetical protein
MGLARGLGVACLVAFATACSTSATITRTNGTSVEGWVRGGTPESIIVEPRVGNIQEIERDDIAEIDHPGNVHLLVGGMVLGYGGILVGAGLDDCQQAETVGNCATLFIPAIVGAGIAAWGLVTWAGSKEAVADRRLAARRPRKQAPQQAAPPAASAVTEAPAPPPELPPLPPRAPATAPSSDEPAPDAPAAPPPEPPPDTPVW